MTISPLRVALLACCFAGPAMAVPVTLPPVVSPPNQEQHAGKPVFAELVTPDLAGAERFYGGLFGWHFQDVPGLASPYAEALLNGAPVAGLVQKPLPAGERRQSAWLSFLDAPDVAATVSIATAQGAKILMPVHEAPVRGLEALLADPQGAVFGVLASTSGNPPDVLAAPGTFIWQSLHAADPMGDAAFYKKLFGYEVFGGPPDGDGQHLLLSSENYARASINVIPANYAGHGQWVSYVHVVDANAATAKAVALGGRVLVAPRADQHGGMIAVVADPAGAPIGLFDWPDDDSKELTK